MIKKTRKLPKCVRPDEFIKLIKVIPTKDKVAKVSFLLAYGAGMRISEVCRCEEKHFENNKIFIPESKNGVERYVPIPKGWRTSFFKDLPIERGIRSVQRRFTKYKNLSGINPLHTFHSLRHGFATRSAEAGMPMNHVQVLMGHSNLSTTSIYTKANPIDAIKNYEDLF